MPVWLTYRCTVAVMMLLVSLANVVTGEGFQVGFGVGMLLFWVYFLIDQYGDYVARELIAIQDETLGYKNQIIEIQQKHINYLKGQR